MSTGRRAFGEMKEGGRSLAKKEIRGEDDWVFSPSDVQLYIGFCFNRPARSRTAAPVMAVTGSTAVAGDWLR